MDNNNKMETVPQGLELHHVRHFDWLHERDHCRECSKNKAKFSRSDNERARAQRVAVWQKSNWLFVTLAAQFKWDLGHAMCVPKMLTAFLYHLRLFVFDPIKLQGIRLNAFSVDEIGSQNRFCLLWRWQRQLQPIPFASPHFPLFVAYDIWIWMSEVKAHTVQLRRRELLDVVTFDW